MDSQSITLSDGRALGFQELGDPDGSPLFFFHGTPGSRLVFSDNDSIAQIPGLRLILPERPGYGLSDPQPGRALLDWAADVAELADHLGLTVFAVSGESGGGPHALACAYRLADRVTKALVLSSPAPAGFKGARSGLSWGNRVGLVLGRYAPWLMRRTIRSYAAAFEKDPEGFLDAVARQMAQPDRVLLANRALRQAIIRDVREAYRHGSDGHAVDGLLAMTSRTWGFSLREISVPVFLWHGEDDTLVSTTMAMHLAREIPRCQARFVAGAGHLLTETPEVISEVADVFGREL